MPEHSDQAAIDRLKNLLEQLDDFAPPIDLDEVHRHPAATNTAQRTGATVDTYVRRRRVVAVAAATVVVAGALGVWWTVGRDSRSAITDPATRTTVVDDSVPEPTGSTSPTTSAPERSGSTAAPTGDEDPATPAGSIVDRAVTLGAWDAARLFQVDAQYRESPDQSADIMIANELTSRACYEEQGIELPEFDPGHLAAWAQFERDQWERRLRLWTPAGQDQLRSEGNSSFREPFEREPVLSPPATTPAPAQCYPAATGVTYLGGVAVWSEDQLGNALLGDPAWAPVNWSYGRVPGTENTKAASDECMVSRGWEQWTEPGAYQSLYMQPEVSDTELDLFNDYVDCINSVGAPSVYLTAAAAHVIQFRNEFAAQIEQIESERADALADAYDVLRVAGLDPLSD